MQKSIFSPLNVIADTKMDNLSKQLGGSYEILYYRKNHNGIWLQEEIVPVRNEESIIVLFLVTFRDITPFKEPLEGQSVMTNLSKFARLAWTLTRSKQTNTSGGSGSSANHLAVSNHATPQLANNRSPNILGKNVRSSLNSPSNLMSSTIVGVNRFTETLPQYRHEPPKTPPHILLHYSTFKVLVQVQGVSWKNLIFWNTLYFCCWIKVQSQ